MNLDQLNKKILNLDKLINESKSERTKDYLDILLQKYINELPNIMFNEFNKVKIKKDKKLNGKK